MATAVYQAADGRWIVFSNGIKSDYFGTKGEALKMANKIEFAKKVQAISTTIAQLYLDTKDLDSVYFTQSFDGSGADPIIDADIASLGITAAEVAAGDTLFQQIQNLRNNAAVTAGDYQSTVNALRDDLGSQ